MKPLAQAPLEKKTPGKGLDQFGLNILFFSLGALFLATVAAFLLTRLQARSWPVGLRAVIGPGMVASSCALALTSFALERAIAGIRKNQQRSLLNWLWTSFAFASLFLVLQVVNWTRVWQLEFAYDNLFAFTFSLLTGVHWLHIVGGLIPLGIVIARASRREYSSSRYQGIRFCVQYWHFLGLVWVVLVALLLAFNA